MEKYLQPSGFVVLEINILVSTEVQWMPKEYDSSWNKQEGIDFVFRDEVCLCTTKDALDLLFF